MNIKIQPQINNILEFCTPAIKTSERLVSPRFDRETYDLTQMCAAAIAKAQIKMQSAHTRVPFLYHITPVGNLASITQEGLHVKNNIIDPLKRLYFFDKKNFVTAWSKSTNKEMSEADLLLCSYIFRNEDIALLKVPTSKLNLKKLDLRSYAEMKSGKSGIHHFNKTPEFLDRNDIVEFIYNGNIPPQYVQTVGIMKAVPPEEISNYTGISDELIKILNSVN